MNNLNSILERTEERTETRELSAATVQEGLAALGEKLGEWKGYDSQLPITEITGTRIVKALYQVNKKTGKKLQENSYVRIPTKHLTEEIIVSRVKELSPYILNWLQEVEALSLRDEHKKGRLNVFCNNLTLDSLIDILEQQNEGGRLNKEKVESWFTDKLEESLTIKFAAKMGITEEASEEQLVKLENILKAYKTKFASLASPKCFLKEEDCFAMIAVIEACEPEEESRSLLGSRFITRLKGMNEKEEDLLMSL